MMDLNFRPKEINFNYSPSGFWGRSGTFVFDGSIQCKSTSLLIKRKKGFLISKKIFNVNLTVETNEIKSDFSLNLDRNIQLKQVGTCVYFNANTGFGIEVQIVLYFIEESEASEFYSYLQKFY